MVPKKGGKDGDDKEAREEMKKKIMDAGKSAGVRPLLPSFFFFFRFRLLFHFPSPIFRLFICSICLFISLVRFYFSFIDSINLLSYIFAHFDS